ncbi:DEAD/DEAH box helicase [Cephaloticoccus primus]|uniref:DEAD/DEAH box helicase n=1 Tax=Cephaloticoccus primus TaxID=1548207 RepID=A0A139STR1_9BACT|nr:DEAD/DEAH box helicase [Cephaloticoccus primus]KXU37850.1 DEAD/DEAH box helicase [Cephaloticoccus primus]
MFKKIIAAVRGAFAPAKSADKKKRPSAGGKTATPANPKNRSSRGAKNSGPAGASDRARSTGKPRSEGRSPRPSRGSGGERAERPDGDAPRRKRGGARSGSGAAKSSPRSRRDSDFEHPRREPIKPAVPIDVPKMDTAFSALGLSDPLAYAVQEKGYTEPTPIQAQSIPVILEGRDLIGSAQTGTGKTAAFALPIIQRLGTHGSLRCLVLEPTRELALQVEEAFQHYAKFTDLNVTIVYGGVGYGKQVEDLRRGMDILAATPGRLLDHLEQGNCSLADVDILVLDEVDRMLDMGFLPDVKRIVQQTPASRQTLFFTATLPPEIASLAGWALRDPVKVEIGRQRSPAETVAHAFYPVVASQKFDLLQRLLEQTEFKSVIVFTRTRMGADRIAARLRESGHTVGVLHSDRSQRERVEALQGFKSGQFEVLVATDIAARGLDIAGVSHVVNYDVPENAEDYVHRIGRTGRAQTSGDAFTLVTEEDVRDARSIERYMGVSVERKKIDGFPYIYSALFDETVAGNTEPKPASRLHRGVRR